MNIQFNQQDMDLLKEAKKLKDWKILKTFKQRFMYQRYVALPANDMKAVKEIANMAKIQENKNADIIVKQAEMIFK